jgi:hypothetical protein
MEQNEGLYRALGSMEGKLDLLLSHHAADKQLTNTRLDDHGKRLGELEAWKGKATAAIGVLLTIAGGVWSVFTFLVK